MFEYIKNRIKKDKWSDEELLKAYSELDVELLTQLKGEVSNDTSGTSVPSTPATAGE